ncbi:MAG: polyprenyl synthetase family protein, partial [Rhodospirillaceae bacterium]|nr:polyprenyl synthetase family protein [Rhodospirillaceae bacterium]
MSDTVVPLEGRAAARRKAASGASLDPLHGLVADDLRAVNGVILDNMQSSVMLISELAAHIVAAGGKRLRPMMTLGSARLCGYTGKRHIDLAACVEF